MAMSGQHDTDGPEGREPATPGEPPIAPAGGSVLATGTEEMVLQDAGAGPGQGAPVPPPVPVHDESATEVHRVIPPLLTDEPAAPPAAVAPVTPTTHADVAAAVEPDDAEAPTSIGGPASKERIAGAAAASREGGAGQPEAGQPAGGPAPGKVRGAKARRRFADAASEARGMASSAASEARERASNTDVKEFAHSTTSLIATARPFFLAGCAAVFAVLGFLEGDSGTAELFVFGSLLFVIGAAFSGEINAYLASRSGREDRGADEER